jgi:DNA-directed RNA polymerase specialized sigma24 family protein
VDGELIEQRLAEREGLRLWNSLIRFLRWSRAKDVEDVASESFLRLLQNLRAGEEIGNLKAYLRQIARNVLQEQHRQRQRESALAQNPLVVLSSASTQEAEALSRCLYHCKKTCLSRQEIALIEAYYGPAKKVARRRKLAAMMSLSANGLCIQAFRLRRKLADCMKRCEEANFGRNGSRAQSLSTKRDARA